MFKVQLLFVVGCRIGASFLVLPTLDLHGIHCKRGHYLLIEIPKVLLFGVLLTPLSLIYKIIVFNIMLLVLNACPGPPIAFNREQGHLNLSAGPVNREQVVSLAPPCLYHCWCIIDTA